MSAPTQSANVLLSRVVSLKESSPLILLQDTIAQSSIPLVREFIHSVPHSTNVVYVSYETISKPSKLIEILQNKENVNFSLVKAYDLSLKKVIEEIDNTYDPQRKNLVLIDSINYVDTEHVSRFLTTIIKPNVTVLTTYHTSLPEVHPTSHYHPSSLKILQFIASSIFEITPQFADSDIEEVEKDLNNLKMVKGLNSRDIITVNFINRRKSGRSTTYKFVMNFSNHQYNQITMETTADTNDLSMFDNLTTFNLNTSAKQKLAREKVDLPYLDAQNFESGGAIVYEFEKDDDYDEEDPYEDPF